MPQTILFIGDRLKDRQKSLSVAEGDVVLFADSVEAAMLLIGETEPDLVVMDSASYTVLYGKAHLDGLTGLLNRGYVTERLLQELERSDRTGSPISLCMLDVDHFKRINDQHGHLVGDDVLVEMAALLRLCSRSADMAGRFGGEEFVIVLPETDLSAASAFAERILSEIRKLLFEAADSIFQITASIGIAEYRRPESLESLIHRADLALYRAKNGGRNRVVADA